MTACVNCSRALQPAWKYCIFCGTRTPVAATAPRSRPLPKRTPVPGYASVSTAQSPIVPPPAPAPLSAAPVEEPVSSVWPESMGERPSLRSALAATEVPAPTPPVEDAPPPVDREPLEAPFEEPVAGPAEEPADEADEPEEPIVENEVAEESPQPGPEPAPGGSRRSRSRGAASTALLESPVEVEPLEDEEDEDEEAVDRSGSVNTLAVLALLIGVLACPLAAPFGHLALGQVRASGERGVIPAWIAIVLGYLWLGFWIVFVITYFATNG